MQYYQGDCGYKTFSLLIQIYLFNSSQFHTMSRGARGLTTKIVDPITLDYAKGMLSVIQSRIKSKRSVNDHIGTKVKKQFEEFQEFKVIFPASTMALETVKSWFKTSYDMIKDFYAEVVMLSNKQDKLTNIEMTKDEKIACVTSFLRKGLDMPHPTIGTYI